jgi:hypothetical protein
MARIRTIKPEFWKHEGLCSVPESTHMFAAALLNYSDDFGYFNANPGLIKGEIYPLREPSVSIPESLRSLQATGYIRLGTADGRRYGHIIAFEDHQRVSHPTPSKISVLPIAWDISGNDPEQFAKAPETFRPEQGKEQGTGNRELEQGESVAVAPPPPSKPLVVEMVKSSETVAQKPAQPELPEIPVCLDRRRPETAEIVPLDPLERARDAYNLAAERVGWSECTAFSDARQRALRKRLAEAGGLEGWCRMLAKAVQSKFLRGENDRQWRPPGIDWFLKPANFIKITEGSYDDATGGPQGGGADALDAGFARAAAAYGD